MEDPATTGKDMTARGGETAPIHNYIWEDIYGGRVGGEDGDDVIQDERRGADRIRLA